MVGPRLELARRPDLHLAEDWPKYEVAGYTRAIDYDAKWSREDYTRRQGNYPRLGNLPMPETKVTSIVSGNYAWDMQGDKPVPFTSLYLFGVPYADLRQLELALTPHGFLKAALAAKDATAIRMPLNGASDFGLSAFGRMVTIVTFTMGKYKINGTINDQNLVELTDAWFPNPVYGDMDYEFRYTRYKELRRRDVSRPVPRASGRSPAELRAQRLRIFRRRCEAQRAGRHHARAGRRDATRP